jgi:hypothetical protein
MTMTAEKLLFYIKGLDPGFLKTAIKHIVEKGGKNLNMNYI